MSDSEVFNVSLKVDITRPSGANFFDAALNYANMGYEKMVEVEKIMTEAVNKLQALGEAEVAKRK